MLCTQMPFSSGSDSSFGTAKTQLGGNFKVLQGAASTQDSGSRRTITRGAVLDRSDFSNQNLAGVSFQQSLCRECDFENTILKGASFFDGDLTQANMEGADVSNVNFELACMKDANLKNAIVNEAYILGLKSLCFGVSCQFRVEALTLHMFPDLVFPRSGSIYVDACMCACIRVFGHACPLQTDANG